MKFLKKYWKAILLLAVLPLLYFGGLWALDYGAGIYYPRLYQNRLADKAEKGGATYYLSPSGNDQDDGLSEGTPWQSLEKINGREFHPGDRILLEGGQVFRGTIKFDGNDLGTPEKPVTLSSYGKERATIEAGDGYGVYLLNAMGIRISRIRIEGSGREQNQASGIAVVNNLRGDIRLEHIRIDSVETSGFGKFGILIDGARKKSGFRDVLIAHSSVHDNAEAGLYVYGEFDHLSEEYAHSNITIRYVEAYNNPGIAGPEVPNTGSGIVLSDIDTGLIERCVAHHNGWLCSSTQGGPVGIWAWDSRHITIQHCESYENKTGGKKDGGGFDLDGGCVNSILQYNYSHDNDGSGYLLAQFPYARAFHDNIVRYNISQNDGQKNGTAGIYFWGDIRRTYVYNNTIYTSAGVKEAPAALGIKENVLAPSYQAPFPSDAHFYNNILVAADSAYLIRIPYNIASLKFGNNCYYAVGSIIRIAWKDVHYESVKDWKADISGRDATTDYLTGDPGFIALGKGPTFNHADSLYRLDAYQLRARSPLIDSGRDLSGIIPQKPGTIDFLGHMIPINKKYDIGACEFNPSVN